MKTNKILGPVLIVLAIMFLSTLYIEIVNIEDRIKRLERNDMEVKRVLHDTDTLKVVELKSGILAVVKK